MSGSGLLRGEDGVARCNKIKVLNPNGHHIWLYFCVSAVLFYSRREEPDDLFFTVNGWLSSWFF